MTTRPPLVAGDLWDAVMRIAGDRCQCRGKCGKKHSSRDKEPDRCQVFNGLYQSEFGKVRLRAIPRDPTAPFSEAAALPAERLLAICPECDRDVGRAVKRAVKAAPPQDDGLFAIDAFVEQPVKKRRGQPDVGAA